MTLGAWALLWEQNWGYGEKITPIYPSLSVLKGQ